MQDELRTTFYRLEEVTLPQESLPPGHYAVVIGDVPDPGCFSMPTAIAMTVGEDTPTQQLAESFREWRRGAGVGMGG